MNHFKKITVSLLAITSLSLVSMGAQAGGISIRIGGYGHGSHYGHNSYHPASYSHYRNPVITFRHNYQPYYGYGYRYNSYYGSYGQPYSQGKHHPEHHNRHHNSHYDQGPQQHNRRDSNDSGHHRTKVSSSERHRR